MAHILDEASDLAETSGRSAGQPTESPPLPIEQHVIAAALASERLRGLAEQMLIVLRHVPRDAVTFGGLHNDALTAWCDVDEHYRAYQAILECKGQG